MKPFWGLHLYLYTYTHTCTLRFRTASMYTETNYTRQQVRTGAR